METLKLIQFNSELENTLSKIKFQNDEILNYFKESQPTKENKEFLDRKSTAELFGVSLVCIHDWQNNGILKCYKMGRRSYFKYSELLETLYNSNRSKK